MSIDKRRLTLLPYAALICALILVLSACSRPVLGADTSEDMGAANITLGVEDDGGSRALVEVYAGVLRRSGYTVNVLAGVSARRGYMKALESGEVDAVLARSGKLLSELEPKSTQGSTDDVISALNEALPADKVALKPTKADDKDILVTTAALAEKYKLRSTADMAKACRNLVFGVTMDFISDPYGFPLIEKKERCLFKEIRKFSREQETTLVRALQKEEVQVANMSSSDPAIKDNRFTVIEDSNDSFISQYFVPVVVKDEIGKKAQTLWNEVAAKLDGDSLTFLKREMIGNTRKTPTQAAEKWLDENGFRMQ